MSLIAYVEQYIKLAKSDATKTLGLRVGGKDIVAGDYLPLSEAVSVPEISLTTDDPAGRYVTVCVDLDGPYPSFPFLSPILHWVQSDLQASRSTKALTTEKPFIANYIGPGPPPGSSPHRYVFLLYNQPEEFDLKLYAPPGGKEYGNMARMRYDLAAFEEKAKLGKPIAVNYFTSN
ncbi:hypothetical protein LTR84_011317 [Exophiala bonariae]|uniref:YbhB/YbcL family Raf kinase inhibitor-like protein n=1 Tax=Exophiala bonariae TaxID=1690606 RepID=A0AAV9MUN3_9EURO|nr:hypothetical protein LTR84_011317 [Exophiala bonariae]